MSGTGSDLAVRDSAALAIQAGQAAWDKMQLAALGQLGLKDAPEGDLSVFLHVSQRTGLDPFAKQIYMIPRNEQLPNGSWTKKWSIQTGIEGWRVIRARAEQREGVRGTLSRPVWYDEDQKEYKVWTRRDQAPAACEITYTVIDRQGHETPYTSTLNFWEYAQTNNKGELISQWRIKGVHMLRKCTEADVYRMAFPQDFSGIVLEGTMMDAGYVEAPYPANLVQPEPRPRVTAEQVRARSGTDWAGHAERGAQRFAEQHAPQHVTAEVVDTSPSPAAPDTPLPGPQVPPAAEAAGEAITDATWREISQRLHGLGVEEGNRVRIASQIARKSMKDCTEAEGRKIADTLEGLDPAGLDGLLADIAMASDPRDEDNGLA